MWYKRDFIQSPFYPIRRKCCRYKARGYRVWLPLRVWEVPGSNPGLSWTVELVIPFLSANCKESGAPSLHSNFLCRTMVTVIHRLCFSGSLWSSTITDHLLKPIQFQTTERINIFCIGQIELFLRHCTDVNDFIKAQGSSGIWTRALSHPKRESYP